MQSQSGVYTVYLKPDYDLLERMAREFDVILKQDENTQLAEQLFDLGAFPPGTEDGHSPKEQAYLKQILTVVLEKDKLPPELQVYLVDRGYLREAPETVGTLLHREQHKARHDVMDALEQGSSILREGGQK